MCKGKRDRVWPGTGAELFMASGFFCQLRRIRGADLWRRVSYLALARFRFCGE